MDGIESAGIFRHDEDSTPDSQLFPLLRDEAHRDCLGLAEVVAVQDEGEDLVGEDGHCESISVSSINSAQRMRAPLGRGGRSRQTSDAA